MGEMQNKSDAQLLRDYAQYGDEAAFREIVTRHTDLVYSAALRSVNSSDLACDIAQSVFTDLARKARPLASKLAEDASLVGWLYRSTRFAALNQLRDHHRRRAHERQAMEQILTHSESAPDWEPIRPILDEALDDLKDEDRDALLLRYFKNQDFRAVGLALGVSDDTAQKRVSRAVERLREFFDRRGVTVGASGLVVILSTNTVQAAPIGLAAMISTAAALAGTLTTTATSTAAKTIAMTTLQKTLIAATLTVAMGTGIYEARQAAELRGQVSTLHRQQESLVQQVEQLAQERDKAAQLVARLRSESERSNENTAELLQLRGEVSMLRRNPSTIAVQAQPVFSPSETSTDPDASVMNTARELGMAVVRGDAGALDKLADLSKAQHASFNTNRVGLDEAKSGELGRRSFAPLWAAFDVITEAASKGNQVALDAVKRALQIRQLQGSAIQTVGKLAGNGNDAALDILLSYEKHGFLLSSAVGALLPAAKNGNQRAVDALAIVTKDPSSKALWYMAASGLQESAGAGNPVAVDALIGLLATTNRSTRDAALEGLREAAVNQDAKATEALRSIGIQMPRL
jgi:RNA polymerase sigma factor (sigma-70 family)